MQKSWTGSGKRRVRGEAAAARRRAGRPAAQEVLRDVAVEQAALAARISAEEKRAREIMAAAAAEDRLRAAELRQQWPLGDARDLVRGGYAVLSVSRRTGWPTSMLDDVQFGRW